MAESVRRTPKEFVFHWALVFARNLVAMGALKLAAYFTGVQVSWWSLWICAFVFYVVLSFGDLLTDEIEGKGVAKI